MRDLALALISLAVLASAAVAQTVPAPADVEFVGHVRQSVSTITPTGDGFVVDVMIGDNGPFPFALDTGSGNTIDVALAHELGLAATGTTSVQGAGETMIEAGLASVQALRIGTLALRNPAFRVVSLAAPEGQRAAPYRGLIGYELFERLIVRLDQEKRQLVLSDPDGWRYQGTGRPVALEFSGHLPVVIGDIDGVAGRFALDTGQANSVTLFRPFLARTNAAGIWPPKFSAPVGWGIGGAIMAEVARGSLLRLGDVQFARPILYLSLQQSGAFTDDSLAGNLGQGVLAGFNVTFAYGQSRAWFEPTTIYGHGDDLHIMTLRRDHFGLVVESVLPGGAAALAGLQRGDVIVDIDNQYAATVENDELQRIFRHAPGTLVHLLVRSGGHLEERSLTLRPTV